jgi:hypothetical protein
MPQTPLTREEMRTSLKRLNDVMDDASFEIWLDASMQEQLEELAEAEGRTHAQFTKERLEAEIHTKARPAYPQATLEGLFAPHEGV